MICPTCAFNIVKLTEEVAKGNEGATLDCPHCDALLIIKDQHLQEFHTYMNKETNGEWPSDGKNTGYIEC
jgi:hypothetical protein